MPIDDRDRFCRRIVETIPEAIVAADAEGKILLWNAGAEQVFGHPSADVLGRPMDFIIPEKLRERHWEGYRKVMQSGVTKYGKELLAVPALRKDGTRISIEFSVVLLRDASGRIESVVAVIRDVTARWEGEKALREKLSALEARNRGGGTT